jgi:hypothetical protein
MFYIKYLFQDNVITYYFNNITFINLSVHFKLLQLNKAPIFLLRLCDFIICDIMFRLLSARLTES